MVPMAPAARTSSSSVVSSAPGVTSCGRKRRKRLLRRRCAGRGGSRRPRRGGPPPSTGSSGRIAGGLPGLGMAEVHAAAARRAQVADARREGREGMQALAPLVEGERLEVEFEVRGGVVRRGAGEHAELRRRHGERAACGGRRTRAPSGPLPEPGVVLVQGPRRPRPGTPGGAGGGPAGSRRRRGGRGRRRSRAARSRSPCPMPEQLQHGRRADRAGGQDHLARGPRAATLARPA